MDISIGSDLGVVRTVKYPCDLVEILVRYIEEEISYSGEEVEGRPMTTVMTTEMTMNTAK